MEIIYRIAIGFYYLAVRIASLFNAKAKAFFAGRKHLFEELPDLLSERGDRDLVWVHSSSAGEFEQARPIIEKIKRSYSDKFILLTFFSPSGYNQNKNYPLADAVSYMPLDSGKNVEKFLEAVRPTQVIFVKYELWYGYLKSMKKRNIPHYLISAIFRPEQWFFNPLMPAASRIVKTFTTIFVQDEESKAILEKVGIKDVMIAGDTRFDRVNELRLGNNGSNPMVETFAGEEKIWIAGSSHDEDEVIIAAALSKVKKNKLILVPHEVHSAHISRIKRYFKEYSLVLYSELSPTITGVQADKLASADILVIDCVGMLSSLYKYAGFAYVGGGFTSKGIHNILEPATYGCPVIIGRNYRKFREATDLVALGGAVSINTSEKLAALLGQWLSSQSYMEQASSVCVDYVKKNLGATDLIIGEIFKNK